MYFEASHYDEALAEVQLRMENGSKRPWIAFRGQRGIALQEQYKQATEALAKWNAVTSDPSAAAELRHVYEAGDAHRFIRRVLNRRRLRQAKSQYLSPVELASVCAQLGDKEHMFALLEEGYLQRTTDFLWIKDPAYDFLRGDSRYQTLVGKIGLPSPL